MQPPERPTQLPRLSLTQQPPASVFCSCGKIPYGSKQDAVQQALRIQKRPGVRSLKPYKSQLCGCWHLCST